MADYSGEVGASHGLESASVGGPSNLVLPGSIDLPAQSMQPYAVSGMPYPPQYVAPAIAAQQEQLRQFWLGQMQEIHQVGTDPAEFKNHQLPLARIKKIMKSDEDVRMISAEAPVLFARACEMFILELTLRSWNHSEENKRRTLQRNDIAAAITRTDIFDFLVDIVPREERGDEPPPVAVTRPGSAGAPPSANPQNTSPGTMPQPGPNAEQMGSNRNQAALDPSLVLFYMQQQQQQSQQQQHSSADGQQQRQHQES